MSTPRFIALAGLLTLAAYGQVAAQAASRTLATGTNSPDADAEEAFVREYPDALLYKGFYLSVAGDRLEAARVWERYLHVAPAGADTASVIQAIEEAYGREFPDWLVYRGFALFQTGDYQGAERVWARYLEVAPDDADKASVRNLIAKASERQRVATR